MNTAALSDQNTATDQNMPEPDQPVAHPLQGSESKNQILVLNGVRAVACILVFSYHLNFFARHYNIWPALPANGKVTLFFILSTYLGDYFGDSGIILFFLLSSFLLFLPYAKALLFDTPWPGLRRFYLRRIFRIVPGYFVALFLMALFFQPAFLLPSHWHDLWPFLTLSMSYNLSTKLNAPFWTLAIEFQFYLLLPILAWLFRPIVRRGTVGWRMTKLSFCLLIMTAWGLLTRYWGLIIASTPKLNFLIPHSVSTTLIPYLYGDKGKYFEVFAVGMFICMIYTYTQNSSQAERWNNRMRRLSLQMFIAGLILLFFMSIIHFYYTDISTNYTEYHIIVKTSFDPYAYSIIVNWLEWQATAYAIAYGLCFWALLYGSPRLKRPFEWSVLSHIASISFSLYMWHFLLMYLFAYALDNNIRRQGWGSLVQYGIFWCWTFVVIFPVATMLYRWIEQPGMRLGERLICKLVR